MLATYVETKRTHCTREEMAKAMHWALGGRNVTVVGLGMAQWALETGRGASMYNWGVGNIKASTTYDGMYCSRLCNEVIGGKLVWFAPEGQLSGKGGQVVGQRYEVPPGHPQTHFRAYPNLFVGTEDYVEFLKRPRFAKAFTAMLSGNAGSFVGELKRAGYFTAAEEPYRKAVASLQREFVSVLQGIPHEGQDIDPDLQLAIVTAGEQYIHVPGYDLGPSWRDEPEVEDTLPGDGRKA